MISRRTNLPTTVVRSRRSPVGARLARAACLATLATVGWGAVGTTVSAAPAIVQSPLTASRLVGLSEGARGGEVEALQRALIDAGITVPGGPDGVFGPGTRGAVIRFQNANGIASTGTVDDRTAAALVGAGPTTGLASGANGAAVKELQEKLSAAGVYVAGGADGVFGPATQRAVTQFQRWNGLNPTGTVDDATSARLGLGAAPAPPAQTANDDAGGSTDRYVGLTVGDRGDTVKELQRALQSTGLVVRGGADGVFGPATASALRAFQRVNDISETGTLSARGVDILGLGSSAAPAAESTRYVGLSAGTRGAAVKELQQALIAAGVTVRGGADGVFGPATTSALSTYQSAAGLSGAGVVDGDTAAKLGLGSSQQPQPLANTSTRSSDDPYVGMTIGARGDRVAELQAALQSIGLVIRGGADGNFGAGTASALKAFQGFNGIARTGVLTARGVSILRLGTGEVVVGGASNNYGIERFPMQGLCFFGDTWHAPRGGGRLHVGTDFIAEEGKLLYAVADGEITKLFWDQPGALHGNGVRLTAPDGTYFIYLHMSGFAPGIEEGTKVTAGDVIGFNGNTGSSATAHLHFEIHPGGGAPINPYPIMKQMDECRNTQARYQSSFT